jgi:hypothetical protein
MGRRLHSQGDLVQRLDGNGRSQALENVLIGAGLSAGAECPTTFASVIDDSLAA